MKRRFLVLLLAFFPASPLWAGPQKQNFALSFNGGVSWEAGADLFENTSPLAGVGLEYYPIDQAGLGAQFVFSTRDNRGNPISFGLGSIGASGSRSANEMLQTLIYLRIAEQNFSSLKFFILAGPTFNRVTRTAGVQPAFDFSGNSQNKTTLLGGKLGTGLFVRLKNETHLNFMLSVDSKPQPLFSAQAGLTFFFNPFQREKIDPTD